MPRDPKPTIELKASYLLPALFVLGALINLGVSQALSPVLDGFAEFSLQISGLANYGQDPFELSFAPVDADIIEDVRADQVGRENESQDDASAQPTPTPIPAALTATPTSPLALPTLPDLPTIPPVLPTLLPLLPTLLPVLPTLQSILPDLPLFP